MTFKKLKEYCDLGYKEAKRLRLNNSKNWKPLFVYIHVSRLVIGLVFGIMIGFLIGIIF